MIDEHVLQAGTLKMHIAQFGLCLRDSLCCTNNQRSGVLCVEAEEGRTLLAFLSLWRGDFLHFDSAWQCAQRFKQSSFRGSFFLGVTNRNKFWHAYTQIEPGASWNQLLQFW